MSGGQTGDDLGSVRDPGVGSEVLGEVVGDVSCRRDKRLGDCVKMLYGIWHVVGAKITREHREAQAGKRKTNLQNC